MDVTITVRLPGKLPFRRRWAPLPVLLLVLAMPLAVLASDRFSDVLTTNPAHGDINAIATAGITAGCNPPTNTLYCPADAVTRQQMASFLHRALGRVAYDPLESGAITSDNNWTKKWTHSLTTGLPSSALAGAAGFIKVDATIVWANGHAGFDCAGWAWLEIDGVQISTKLSFTVDDGDTEVISLTAAKKVTASGTRTVGVVVQDVFPCSEQTVHGDATSSYFPFGSSGNNNP